MTEGFRERSVFPLIRWVCFLAIYVSSETVVYEPDKQRKALFLRKNQGTICSRALKYPELLTFSIGDEGAVSL